MNLNEINYIDIDELIIENDQKGIKDKPVKKSDGSNQKEIVQFDIKEGNTNKNSKELHKLFQQKENCLFLTGAGISATSGLPLMWQLWLYFTGLFNEEEHKDKKSAVFYKNNENNFIDYIANSNHDLFNELFSLIGKEEDEWNIEGFLSTLAIYIEGLVLIDNSDNQENLDKATKLRGIIQKELKKLCFLKNNNFDSEYPYFLQYLSSIRGEKNKSRLKIFTLNYDLLFEQVASKYLYTIIDGFSFTSPRKFSSTNFDLDIIEKKDNRLENNTMHSRVFHLYKMHGSLSRIKDDDSNIYENFPRNQADLENDEQGLLIVPGKAKYEESYNMPYFEMLTRFQIELRKKETVLNIIGYGFGDTHINHMVIEALNNNPALTLNIFSSPDGKFYSIEDGELKLNDNFKNLEYYIRSKRINIYNMRFWGLVNLLEVSKPETPEEELFRVINNLKLNHNQNDN